MSAVKGSFTPNDGIIVRIGITKPHSFSSDHVGPAPNIVRVNALVDTGASRTGITADVADRASLPIKGREQLGTWAGPQWVNWYDGDVLLFFEGNGFQPTPEIKLVECARPSPRFDALLGRDVLCKFNFQMTKDHRFVLSI